MTPRPRPGPLVVVLATTASVALLAAILHGTITVADDRFADPRLHGLPEDAPDEVVSEQRQAAAWAEGRVAPRPVPAQTPAPDPARRTPAKDANVVLVVGCTVRKDQMGPWGGGAGVTPFLDRLAARGAVFDDVIGATPWTKPAVTAILTGRHALGLGLADPGPGRNDRALPDEAVTLAERMKASGRITIGASANPNITATFGFDQGFDAYQLGLGAEWGDKTLGKDLIDVVLRNLDDLRADDDRPFFLQAVVFDTHARRTAPPHEVAPFEDAAYPERIARYRAHMARLDAAVGRLWAGLQDRGLLDDTVFVFVGDHGEGMAWPHHHGPRHGLYFGSSTTHVPWILAGPGIPAGRRVLGTVSHVDLVPTLLATLGLPVPDDGDGLDLSAVVATPDAVAPERVVYADTWFAEASRVASFTRTRACQLDLGPEPTTKSAEGVPFWDGCTDRHRDPLALSPTDPDDGWRDLLTAWRTTQQRRAAGYQSREARVVSGLAAQLAALGYVDDPEDVPEDLDD